MKHNLLLMEEKSCYPKKAFKDLYSISIWVRKVFSRPIALWGKFYYRKVKIEKKKRLFSSVLFLPPTYMGSLGDESLILGLINLVKENQIQRICIMPFGKSDNWSSLGLDIEVFPVSFTELAEYKSFGKFIRHVVEFGYFIVIGADVLDGGYSIQKSIQRIKFAKLINQIGLITSIVSFSFNSSHNGKIQKNFKTLNKNIKLITRDPISQLRVANLMNSQVSLSADLAFLLPTNVQSETVDIVRNWREHNRKKGNLIIGININPLPYRNTTSFEQNSIINSYKETLINVFNHYGKIAYIFIPHDFRKIPNDLSMIEDLMRILPTEIVSCSLLPQTPFNASEARSIVSVTDILLTGRMHVAIHGLSQCIPPACITYQDKFEGLMELFNLTEITISHIDATDPNLLYKFICSVIERREELSLQISSKLPVIQNLARKNFSTEYPRIADI